MDLFPDQFKALWKIMNVRLDEEKRWVKPESPVIDISDEVKDRLQGLGYIR